MLIIETLLTYRYVGSRMARDQALLQALEEASSLEHQLHRERVDTNDDLRRILRYVNAGHLSPFLVALNSGEVQRLETGGRVLGLLPKAIYQDGSVKLNGEEILILYSDGLMEATNQKGEEFGEARVLSAELGSVGPARQVVHDVLAEATRFMDGALFHDDLTIFVANFAPFFHGEGRDVI